MWIVFAERVTLLDGMKEYLKFGKKKRGGKAICSIEVHIFTYIGKIECENFKSNFI